MQRLCFSTADDPFYKATISKYYPEVVVFDSNGKELARCGPKNKKVEKYNMSYIEDFRDSALRINDDRKIQIGIAGLEKPGLMMLLLVREKSTAGLPVKQGDFDRAWFRLSNDDTNQTFDYSLVKKVPLASGSGAEAEVNEEAEEPAEGTNTPQNTLTYVHGRLYVNEQKCWVFESLKTCFQGKDYPDIALTLAELYRDSNQEVKNYDKILADAQNSLKEMRKEK